MRQKLSDGQQLGGNGFVGNREGFPTVPGTPAGVGPHWGTVDPGEWKDRRNRIQGTQTEDLEPNYTTFTVSVESLLAYGSHIL